MGFQHALYFSAEDDYPKALQHSQYTSQAIQKRMVWVKARQKRFLTGQNERFLRLYLESLRDALKDESKDNLDDVQRFEREMELFPRYAAVPDDKEIEMIIALKQLMRLRLLGRYGDEMARIAKVTKAQIQTEVGLDYERTEGLLRYWTVLQEHIASERLLKQARDSQKKTASAAEIPTFREVKRAANALCFDEDELFTAIRVFVVRGEFHSDLDEVIRTKRPSTLAQTIFADLEFLKLYQTFNRLWVTRYRAVIFGFRDRYFLHRPGSQDLPWMWKYSEQYLDEAVGDAFR